MTARTIDLGGGATDGALNLSDAELGQITAGVLLIGRSDNPGAITVTAPVTQSGDNSGGATTEDFDSMPQGSLPVGWGQYSNVPTPSFTVSGTASWSGSNSLSSDGGSDVEARAWLLTQQPADTQVDANVYLGSLVPIGVLARGTNLDTATPTYYAVSVTRGMELDLQRVVNGKVTTLATVVSTTWFSNQWLRVNGAMTRRLGSVRGPSL